MNKPSFEELKLKIKSCKTRKELDNLRLPLLKFVDDGGAVDEFYKLQKMFITRKRVTK